MHDVYARDLDLNLLRVFVVVAEAGSVTAGASRLYLTQPAVSAALRRLTTAVGAPLFARAGRGLTLTARGRALLGAARPHLEALVAAALSPVAFDPKTSERTLRLGLSDSTDTWLLPALLRVLRVRAPSMRLIVIPVQFRTIGEALRTAAVDLAVTVADELPADARRQTLFVGRFVCVYDAQRTGLGRRVSLARYLAHEHVVVSYNGDLRGIVEDALGHQRKVRVSVPSFSSVGAVIEGSALLATLPEIQARDVVALRPRLRVAELPFDLGNTPVELIYRSALQDDAAATFLRSMIEEVTRALIARRRTGRTR